MHMHDWTVPETETVVEEYRDGKLVKRTVTTTKTRRVPRDIDPLTPLKDKDPWERIRKPWDDWERRNPIVYTKESDPLGGPTVMWDLPYEVYH